MNDTLRYLIFVLTPILTFFLSFLYFKKKTRYLNFNLKIFELNSVVERESFSRKKLIILLFFLSFLFLYQDWDEFGFSIFEEGMPLSGGTIFELGLKPWIDIYLNTGLFHDLLDAKIAWSITDNKTIGSYKFYIHLLNLISQILIIYFLFKLSLQINLKKIRELFFILSVFALFASLNNASLWKDIPVILFLISILNYLNFERRNFSLFSICFLSVFTFFWSLDRGFFIFLTFIPFLLLVFLNNKKEFFKFIITFLIYVSFLIIIFGIDIFLSFLNHTYEIFTQHEMINGIIHPTPFSGEDNASRASKALMLIILNSIITILIVFDKEKLFNNNTKFIFIFFKILNFLIYKSALSRSDGGHIQTASYLSILLFLIYVIFYLLNYFVKLKHFKIFFSKKNIIFYLILIFILSKNIFSLENIYKFPKNIKNFVSASDENFLDKNYYRSLKKVNAYFNKDECIFSFSYDLAIFYLINKKSCSKFFNVWVIGSNQNQKKYILQIDDKKPKFILKGGIIKFQSLDERYPYINKYIEENYQKVDEFDGWQIYKKNT